MSQVLHRAKEAVHLVGVLYTLGSVAALAIEVAAPHTLTTSHTLRVWIAAGAILGAIMGYLRTAFAFARKGRDVCLSAATKYAVSFVLSFLLLIVVPLLVLNPQVAERHQSLRAVREFLINWMLLTNFVEFLGGAAAAFFLIGAIVLCSPHVANPRGGIYK